MAPPFLPTLSARGRRTLEAAAFTVDARAGERVIRRGDKAAGLYLVERGQLRVFQVERGGHPRTLYRLRPGDACVLALNSTFRGVAYPAHVEAEEDTRIRVVPAEVWRALFATEDAARRFTVRLLASWVVDLLGVIDDTLSADVPMRLADELVERMGPDARVQLTHAQLAATLGTAREVVSRTLGRWRHRGLVRTGRGWVEVVDATRLAEEAGA